MWLLLFVHACAPFSGVLGCVFGLHAREVNTVGKADLFLLASVFMKMIESRGFYDTHHVKAVLNTVFLIMLQAQTAVADDK